MVSNYKSNCFLHTSSKDHTFNFTGKLFQPLVFYRIERAIKKNVIQPIVVEFDPTSNCNQKCRWCISKSLLNKGEIPFSQLRNLLDIFKNIGINAVVFTGGGEPLLHSAMPEPLFYAKKSGFDIGLITNGTLLYKYISYFPDLLSWLRVSVDAANAKSYSILHYNGSTAYTDVFHQIIKGMNSFAKKKCRTRLGFSFLISSRHDKMLSYSNTCEIYNACKLAKDIGCDYFEIKPNADKSHYLHFPSKKELNSIKQQYDACKVLLEDKYFKIYCSESLQDFLDKGLPINNKYVVQNKPYTECLISKFRTVLTHDGIFPCPYFRGNRNKGYTFNFKDSYLTTYNFQNILNLINKKVNPARDCKWYCIRHKQNLILQVIYKSEWNNFRLVNGLNQEIQRPDPFI